MRTLLLLAVLVLLISGCIQGPVIEQPENVQGSVTNIEDLGNACQGRILTIEGTFEGEGETHPYTRHDISYTREDRTMRNYFLQELRPALEWVAENTAENSKFFNWWDYGHMIQGFACRGVVVFSPSRDMLWSLSSGQWDEEGSGPFASNQDTKDVAFGLLDSDPASLAEKMDKHSATHVFVTAMERYIVEYWVNHFRGESLSQEEIDAVIPELTVSRMLNQEDIPGFELVYSDSLVKIYEKLYFFG